MLTTHARADIGGVPLLLLESQFSFCVIYGMERSTFTTGKSATARDNAAARAWQQFARSCEHAATCAGLLHADEES